MYLYGSPRFYDRLKSPLREASVRQTHTGLVRKQNGQPHWTARLKEVKIFDYQPAGRVIIYRLK